MPVRSSFSGRYFDEDDYSHYGEECKIIYSKILGPSFEVDRRGMERNGLGVGDSGELSVRLVYFEYFRIQTRCQSSIDKGIVLGMYVKLGG
jgi:hypothetical protein